MSYSNSFPQQRPTLNLDFVNSGKLDSRLSYSRSSTGTAFSAERHLSSENLHSYSNDLSQSVWVGSGATTPSTNNAAPDGTSTATALAENTGSAGHALFKYFSSVSGENYTATAYAKSNGRTKFNFILAASGGSNGFATVEYDLTAVTSTVTGGAAVSHSIAAIGSTGWYKCVVKITATGTIANAYQQINLLNASGAATYTGDGSSGLFLWGMQVSSTGETVLNATSGSIHREYSPLLKEASADEPRFEFSATDGQSAAGSPRGLLIESQSTNLATYGSDLTNAAWNPLSATAANAAIGPDGTLSAAKLTSGTGSGIFPRFRRLAFLSTSKTQTFSVYVKPLEYSYLNISQDGHSTQMVHYNLTGSGSISSASGCSGLVEQCGNGWYRLSFTHTNATSSANLAVVMQSTSTYSSETGNSYDGMLFASAQLEDAAAASSFIGTTSSTVTRAADSCSVDLSSFYTGGELSGIVEAKNIGTPYPTLATLTDSTANQRILLQGNDAGTYVSSSIVTDGAVVAAPTSALTAASSKVGFRCDTDDFGTVVNGGTVATDTSGTQPATMTTLHIGQKQDGNFQVNGHIGRLSLYSAALSNLELQSLTSNP